VSAACSASSDDFAPLAESGETLPFADVALEPDVAFMLEVAGGSETAFTTLVRRHQNSLLNFFVRMGASSDCEDLVQETFVRLFHYRLRYRPAARFTTFLYHLARNVWADRGRKIVRFERLAAEFQNEVEIAAQRAPERSGARFPRKQMQLRAGACQQRFGRPIGRKSRLARKPPSGLSLTQPICPFVQNRSIGLTALSWRGAPPSLQNAAQISASSHS